MPRFNKDILFLVIEELQRDIKSLFSCLLVSRNWCETAMPILWKDPWCYDINYSKKNSLFIIIAIYLSDNVKEFKDFLTRQGLSSSPKSLLFDYLSFCRSFNVPVLNTLISICPSELHNQFLLQEIYGFMIKKCPGFKCASIELFKHQPFYFLEDKARLGSLCELNCDTSVDSLHFNELANVCNFIQRLIIINKCLKVNDGIVNLIEVQKNLKYFEWKDDFNDFEDNFENDPYEKIFLALAKNADTLNFLILSLHYIESQNLEQIVLQDLLTKLYKLKTLIITGDVFMQFSEEQIRMLVYQELEIFNMDLISLPEVSCIIENSGGHLKEIPLNYDYYESNYDNIEEEESIIFIRQIYEKCILIENLSLIILSSEQYFTEFERLLISCKNLESLTLRMVNNEDEEAGEDLLNTLIRSAPTNLNEIRFLNNFKFSLESLENFLEGWKGRHVISIYTSNPIHKENSYMNLVNRYKNIGVIKNFICDL
jgi:hypothetical protein